MLYQTGSGLVVPHEIPPEWQPVEEAASLLEGITFAIGNPFSTNFDEPVPGSCFSEDSKVNSEFGKELAIRVHDLYLLAVHHARLGASSLHHAPNNVPNPFAGFTCGRAVLEACSTASWLIDSHKQVGTIDRYTRLLDFIARDLARSHGFSRNWPELAEEMGKTIGQLQSFYESCVEQIVTNAHEVGIQPESFNGDPRRPIFLKSESATCLAGQYFDDNGKRKYQFYSAFAHAGPRVMDQHWMVRADIEPPNEFRYQPNRAFWLITDMMTWLGRTAERIAVYAGGDVESLVAMLGEYAAELEQLRISAELKPTDTVSPH